MGNFQHLEEDPVTGFRGIISSMLPLRNQPNLVHLGSLCCAYIRKVPHFQANCFQFRALYHEDVLTMQLNAETFGRTCVMYQKYISPSRLYVSQLGVLHCALFHGKGSTVFG